MNEQTAVQGQTINPVVIAEFMRYFTGSPYGYGVHIYEGEPDERGKIAGKSWTVSPSDSTGMVTKSLYEAHLEGSRGLGIIPVTREGKCKFTVIDVDIYKQDLSLFLNAIERMCLPFIPFMSKSGGLHLYTFFKDFVDTKDALDFTRRLGTILTLDSYVRKHNNGMLEVFPKQTRLLDDQKGSWINLPYYKALDTKQYAMQKGRPLSVDEAILLIPQKAIDPEILQPKELAHFFETLPFADAPPCLQSIYMLDAVGQGGGRNTYLFSFGTYLKKKNEQMFEAELFDVNNAMGKPLDAREIEDTILSSLRKKDYGYKCTQSPLCDYCNKQECKLREFGIGKDSGYFSVIEYGQLTQVKTSEPYYEWLVRVQGAEEWTRLRFQRESDIIGQDAFLQLCVRELHELPPKVKQSEWFKIVRQALKDIEVITPDMRDELSSVSMFKSFLKEFLTERAEALNRDQILTSQRVFYDKAAKGYLFRSLDLVNFLLVIKNFKLLSLKEVSQELYDIGCTPRNIRTSTGKQFRAMFMPFNVFIEKIAMYDDAIATDEMAVPEFKTGDEEPAY